MSNTISPQDLRLGNLILRRAADLETGKYFYEPIQVDIDDIKLLAIRQDQDIYRPIPLTEEILVKCGFIKSSDTNWQYQLGVGGIKMYCRYNTEWYFELGGIYMGSRPKYLNELQNIFHAMSGRELEIKL